MTKKVTEEVQDPPGNPIYQWRLDTHCNGYVVVPDDRDNHGCTGWSTMEVDEDLIASWPAFNTGIRCDGLAAIDSDVDDKMLARKINTARRKILGPTPLVRWSRAPRKLWLYRREEAMRSIKTGKFGGHEVEIFCDRGKFTSFGTHPKAPARCPFSNRFTRAV